MEPWFQVAVSGLGFLQSRDLNIQQENFVIPKRMTTSNEKLPPGTLCVVCEDLATGNHYNVASCSGCKTFFRRAIVNNRTFACIGNGNCPVNKDVRCACRHCRFRKCLEVGMNKNAIQNDRDRIGYTKRTRRKGKTEHLNNSLSPEHGNLSPYATNDSFHDDASDFADEFNENGESIELDPNSPHAKIGHEPMLERLAQLENNFSLLLSRGKIEPYATLDDALAAPSRFNQPVNVKITDPIATPEDCKEHNRMPFWRSRIIALYIDWAKTFFAFRKLPYADRVALITNHASSYMIMCEAFRTPEHKEDTTDASIIKKEEDLPSTMKNNLDDRSLSSQEITNYSMTSSPSTNFTRNMHTFFDPELIRNGNSCLTTGVRSVVDVPPTVHYPTVGSLSGLTPVMAVMIDYVMKPFRKLNITTTEFATLQAIMFFDPDTDGLDSASQRNVAIEQKKFITALYKHVSSKYDSHEAAERYSSILLRIPTIRKVAAKKNESLQIIDMFNLFSLNTLVRETTLGIRQPPHQLDQMNLM